MQIANTVEELHRVILETSKRDKKVSSIGFIPTMGALHHGHLQLIKKAQKENEITICSIFVNPTQFNDESDLIKYPRTEKEDALLLESINTDILFLPTVVEVYPNGINEEIKFEFGGLENEMEGAFRPGHFQGVGQVVNRLLEIVQPDTLYMGQKDFQQFSLINYMIKDRKIPVRLRVVPIVRDENGLALSSRNVRLTPDNKGKAHIIYSTLKEMEQFMESISVHELQNMAMAKFSAIDDFKPEYVTIADGYSLKPIENFQDHYYVVVCTAVWAGDVRLIDNHILKAPSDLDLFVKN